MCPDYVFFISKSKLLDEFDDLHELLAQIHATLIIIIIIVWSSILQRGARGPKEKEGCMMLTSVLYNNIKISVIWLCIEFTMLTIICIVQNKKNNEDDWNERWKGIETWFMTSGLASRGSHLLEDLEEGVAIIRWCFAFYFLLKFVVFDALNLIALCFKLSISLRLKWRGFALCCVDLNGPGRIPPSTHLLIVKMYLVFYDFLATQFNLQKQSIIKLVHNIFTLRTN